MFFNLNRSLFKHIPPASRSLLSNSQNQHSLLHKHKKMGSLPQVVEDIQGVVQVFSDGSLFHLDDIEFNLLVKDVGSVAWKDLIYDKKHNLSLRVYKPKSTSSLPIIYYLHGGGFCLGSFQWPNFHNCCLRLSSALNTLVVAPDYRLAPESRLPAAMEDSLSAVKWLQYQALSQDDCDTWLQGDAVDFNQVFVLGNSSGGNIAHHLAVRLGPGSTELKLIRIRGYVLMAPVFRWDCEDQIGGRGYAGTNVKFGDT